MLYIVATPIGNLGDITLRALETLQKVDLIAAEDTRHTAKLLLHYDIRKPVISYYEHNKESRGTELINKLKSGLNIALVSDAGTPGISDPGEDLIRQAIDNNIEVTMLPGAVAGIMGLVLSGLPTRSFVFEGFIPDDRKTKIKVFESLRNERRTTVFYAAPHNIVKLLEEIKEYIGDREIVLCRELTKKFEEFRRGTATEHAEYYKETDPKGEFVLVIEGSDDISTATERISDNEVYDLINNNMTSGMTKNEAIKAAVKATGISRNEIYSIYENVKGTR